MNAQEVASKAREFGADLIGFAPVSSFPLEPSSRNPLSLSDRAKTVIVVGHRIIRGTLRGVEEATNFSSTYVAFGNNWAENEFLSRTVYLLASWLEEQGAEAIPLLAGMDGGGQNLPDYRVAAEAAGLGKVGKGGFLLTQKYGHRQRLAMILVDVELKPEAMPEIDFCATCNACIEACPLQAITLQPDGTTDIDLELCARCKNGAFSKPNSVDKVDRYAASCGRACMVALEGKIGNKFKHQFRQRQVWSIDLRGNKMLDGVPIAGKQTES